MNSYARKTEIFRLDPIFKKYIYYIRLFSDKDKIHIKFLFDKIVITFLFDCNISNRLVKRCDDVLVNNIPCQPQPDIRICTRVVNEFI